MQLLFVNYLFMDFHSSVDVEVFTSGIINIIDKENKLRKIQDNGEVQKVLSMRQIFNPMFFVINTGVLCYNRHTDPTKPYDALCICVPTVKVK